MLLPQIVIYLPIVCQLSFSFHYSQEANNVFSPKSSIPAGANAIRSYYSFIAPPSHRIDMNAKEPSYMAGREHNVEREVGLFGSGLRLGNLSHTLTSYA